MLSRLRELTKSFGSQVGSENERIEQLKRTKAEVEKNVTKVFELLRSDQEKQGIRGKRPKGSKKDIELLGLVENLYNEYKSLYDLCYHFVAESRKTVDGKDEKNDFFVETGSEEEFFSSEEIEIGDVKVGHEVVELRLKLASISGEYEALKLKYGSSLTRVQEAEEIIKELKFEVDKKEREISSLVRVKESNKEQSVEDQKIDKTNKELCSRVLKLESVLKGNENQHCAFAKKLEESERIFSLRIEEFEAHGTKMQEEIESLRAKVGELEEELEHIQGEVGELEDQKTELEGQLERKNNESNSLRTKISELEEELENVMKEVGELEDQKLELEAQLDGKIVETTECLTITEFLDEEVTDSKLQANDFEESLDDLESKKIQLVQKESQNNNKSSGRIRDKPNLQIVAKKMDDLVERFRIGFEDKLRLLSQRILITEQLHYETKESCKVIIDKYKKTNRALEERIANEYKKLKFVSESTQYALINELDTTIGKFEKENENFSSRISKVSIELKLAKRWVKGATNEIKRLKHNVDCLVAYLEHKEEQEVLLRDKIWKLEAKASKEGSEKLNLVQQYSQLEKKLVKYEKLVREKDDRLSSLGEEKREAIRQLCFLVDYQRSRVDNLKLVISKMRTNHE